MLLESRIGEVCEKLQTGKTPPSKEKKYFNGSINWYTPTDLNKRLLSKSKRTISTLAYKDKKAIKYPKGTVLLSCIGEIAKVGITTDSESSSNQQITGLIPNLSKITTEYLYYWCREHKSLLESKATYVTVPMLNNRRLSKIKIFYEKDLIEQKKITNLLTQVETLIAKREESIKLLDELLRSTFLDMFGDPRNNNKKWKTIKKLGDLGNWKSGGTPLRREAKFYRGNIPWVTSGELNEIFISDANEHITDEAILNSNTKKVEVGSLLLGMYDTASLKSSITKSIVTTNQAIAFAKLDEEECNIIYVYYLIQIGREYFKRLQRGARQQNMNITMIKNIPIMLPPKTLQDKFATIVKQVEETKDKYQNSLNELNELFGSLSQKAFKGKLDLSKMELPQKEDESLQKMIDSQKAYDKALETKVYESDFTNVETVSIQSIPKENLETYIFDLIKLNTFTIENIQHLFETDFTYNDVKEKIFKMLEDAKIKQNFKEDYKEKKYNYKIELVVN